jgi:hypothetical protein
LGWRTDALLPAINIFMLDAAPEIALPKAKRKRAESIMGRRPMI